MQTTQEPPTVLQQLDPQGIIRRTNDERAIHLEAIKTMLDQGATKSIITAQICSEFRISRAQAYRDYATAQAEKYAEMEDTDPDENVPQEQQEYLRNLMVASATAAARRGDEAAATRCVFAYEKIGRMSGRNYGKP